MYALEPFAPDIWLKRYPVRYSGCTFPGVMTVVRLSGGDLLIHSPCHLDDATRAEIEPLGSPAFIVAPGTYHHLHIPSCQAAFPAARTFLCPGLETKRPDLAYDGILSDHPETAWAGDLEQAVVRGSRYIWEVAFFHRPSGTLILVDLVENMGDATPGINWVLRFFWKCVFRMWNNPKPAPEYQMGWKDKAAARASLEKILSWDFRSVVMSHGEPITERPRETLEKAWARVLRR